MIPVLLTHHRIGWLVGQVRPPAHSLAVILKGTYDLKPGGVATPSNSPMEIVGDLHEEDDAEKALRYASDGVLFKPNADVLLVGHAHAPSGSRVAKLHVGFQVGAFSKALSVVGDRTERSSLLTSEATPPEPFTKMEIGYARSLGGPEDPKNPLGKGRSKTEAGTVHLPNIEYPESVSPKMRSGFPAGFAPIPLTWPQRMSKAGTYDKKWKKTRWPWFPEDFDWTFFNAAPADQQLPEFLRGDETVYFENLHPKHAEYRSQLPGLRVRTFYGRLQGSTIRLAEIPMNLDTLWVDMDAEQVVLVWRGLRDQPSPDVAEGDYLVAVSEPLAKSPRPMGEYQEEINRLYFPPRPEEGPPVKRETPAKLRATPSEEDEEATPTETPKPPAPPAPARREWCLERLKSKQGFQGQDVTGADLSDLDLEKADFREAILTRANLRGSRLAGADLSGAILREADLADANLEGAILRGADLTGARMGKANLRGATLDEADFSEAYLREASLIRAHGTGTLFTDANLSHADLTEARLPSAMAAGISLHEARLCKADLSGASLERAWGLHVVAEGAILQEMRAAEANFAESNFREIRAAGSIWEKAELFQADFFGADLVGAEFEKANLEKARLSGANLTRARFVKANLEGAELIRANLFRASLNGANVRSAEISESNLFEADVLGLVADGARFYRSNLQRTLMEQA